MTKPDTLDLAAICRRCRSATAGPWGADGNWVGPMFGDPEKPLAETAFYGDLYDGEANAIFIAAARQDVPVLRFEVEQLRAELADAHTVREVTERHFVEMRAELAQLRQERDDWLDAEQKLAEMYYDHAKLICEAIGVKWQPLDGRSPEDAEAYPTIAVEAIGDLCHERDELKAALQQFGQLLVRRWLREIAEATE